jgi:S1-C subfamily serine protease
VLRLTKRFCVLALLLCLPASLGAQTRREVVEKGKQATALVEVEGSPVTSSAFALDNEGRFVTTARALLTPDGQAKEVRLIVDRGELGPKTVRARARRVDVERGLALLEVDVTKAEGRLALVPLALDSGQAVADGMQLIAFGFPLGRAIGGGESPGVNVNLGTVTKLVREKDKLVELEIKAALNPGNQGGPLLNRAGKVIGVIKGARAGTNQVVAIPVGTLREFLFAAEIRFAPPFTGEILTSRQSESQRVGFLLDFFAAQGSETVAVDVVVEAGSDDRRVYPAIYMGRSGGPRGNGSLYEATIVPMPPPARSLMLTVEYESGAVRGRAADRPVRVGDRALRLAEVNRIRLATIAVPPSNQGAGQQPLDGSRARRDPSPLVVLNSPEVIRGPITGLGPLVLDVGGMDIPIDLGRATIIDVQRGDRRTEPAAAHCTVIARRGNEELGRRSFPLVFRHPDGRIPELSVGLSHLGAGDQYGRVELALSPSMPSGACGAGASIRPPAIPPDGTKDFPLEGAIGDVITGGGGRFLLLVLRQSRKLAVFDLNEARIVGNIPLPAQDALVTAGADIALVFDPGSSMLESWALKDLKRAWRRPFLSNFQVKSITLGSDSHGPLLVYVNTRPGVTWGGPASLFTVIDPETLRFARFKESGIGAYFGDPPGQAEPGEARTLPLVPRALLSPGNLLNGGREGEDFHVRASADGRVFGAWAPRSAGGTTFIFDKRSVQYRGVSNCIPGPDGETIFGTAGLFDAEGRPQQSDLSRNQVLLPSSEPGTFLGIGGLRRKGYLIGNEFDGRATCDIYRSGNTRPVVSLDDLDEMTLRPATIKSNDLTLDKRFHFVPAAGLLITVPESNDRLVLRHVDILDRLRRAGTDFLLVTSKPPASAVRGQLYRYRVSSESRQGGVSYELTTGPDGMAIGPDGALTWNVPEAFADAIADVAVHLRDTSGQDVRHTFRVRVF